MATPVFSNPYFRAAFPSYCTRVISYTSQQLNQHTLTVSGQALPEYYKSDEAPARFYTKQHLLLSDEGPSGLFEESHFQPHQATMSLTITQLPTDPAQINRFLVLSLSHLVSHLKYSPSTQAPLIIRGKNIASVPDLLRAAQLLELPHAAFSLRTYQLGFFKPQALEKVSSFEIDSQLKDFINHFNAQRKTDAATFVPPSNTMRAS